MHTVRERTACFVIGVMLFLSEIYLDMVMTDSFFVYNSVGEVASFLKSDSSDFTFNRVCLQENCGHLNLHVCTMKILNECSGVMLSPNGWNLFHCLIYIGYFFLLQNKFYQLSEMLQTFCRTLDALVAEYMHQSDGKKRI